MTGIVYLVGAGPGDPELMTVRGLKRLQQADVVVYDRLVNQALLNEAPPWAERIFAGKAAGHHVMRQEDINALLVQRAQAGQVVVRLKGGDPFVFGRGGEEAVACAEAGVRWEIVPGISSALSVPACAGIPVTHRGISGSFAVVTGHRSPHQDDVDWAGLSGVDTLIVLMGIERLAHIVDRLTQHGRAPETPVAVIERGTLPDERVVIGALSDIVEKTAAAGVTPPATIVVGEVVRLRETTEQQIGESANRRNRETTEYLNGETKQLLTDVEGGVEGSCGTIPITS